MQTMAAAAVTAKRDAAAGPAADDEDDADAAAASSNEEAHSFSNINEHPVDDISLEFFYTPHRLTLLLISVAAVMCCAFVR